MTDFKCPYIGNGYKLQVNASHNHLFVMLYRIAKRIKNVSWIKLIENNNTTFIRFKYKKRHYEVYKSLDEKDGLFYCYTIDVTDKNNPKDIHYKDVHKLYRKLYQEL